MVKTFFNSIIKGFKEFGYDITTIINFVLSLFVYILGIGLVSIIAKITGKHFLDLKFKSKDSLWVKRTPVKTRDEYYRQF